jgi:hypothetical protein
VSKIREKFRERAAKKRLLVPVATATDFLDAGSLFICPPSSKDKIEWDESQRQRKFLANGTWDLQLRLLNLDARLLVRALVDADGKLVFTEDDALWLGDMEDDVLDPIVKEVRAVWKLDEAAKKAQREELEKNSTTPTASSPSGSGESLAKAA